MQFVSTEQTDMAVDFALFDGLSVCVCLSDPMHVPSQRWRVLATVTDLLFRRYD